ncbi:ABC transporter permease [Cognatilysobacter bugurensis]|uniref:ABC transporter n=1 Tax=Cognatilysobacter bugurensis TaxID=543356 RepID=A0A918W9Y0_9GAMM|nr:ABC transporter permease [Lysobacter bugurensis]GHA82975.1 ABC transporter [Lysobacter bugurensis]
MNASASNRAGLHIVPPARFTPWRAYRLEAAYELIRTLRTPSFVLPTLLFPLMFYLLFGVLLAGRHGAEAARYLLATYGVFGVMGAALFGFGVSVAVERERGLLTLKRALPMPPGAYLAAKLATALAFSAVISIALAGLAATLGDVVLTPRQWLMLPAVHVLGALPFCALGLAVGVSVSGSAAPAVVNLLFLPMSFLSGLWMPLTALPPVFAKLAAAWPAYHLGQVALKVIGLDAGGALALHLAVLVGFTAACLMYARWRLARGG